MFRVYWKYHFGVYPFQTHPNRSSLLVAATAAFLASRATARSTLSFGEHQVALTCSHAVPSKSSHKLSRSGAYWAQDDATRPQMLHNSRRLFIRLPKKLRYKCYSFLSQGVASHQPMVNRWFRGPDIPRFGLQETSHEHLVERRHHLTLEQ